MTLLNKSLYIMVVMISILVALLLSIFQSYPHYMYSSIIILFLIILVPLRYGLFSIATIIFSAVYLPSQAFLWAAINGAKFVNLQDHWLQSQIYFVNKAVFMSCLSAIITYSVLRLVLETREKVDLTKYIPGISGLLYVLSSFGFLGLFWLTDPGETLLTVSYSTLLTQRFEGYNFAGGLGFIVWLFAFNTFKNNKFLQNVGRKGINIKITDYLFLFCTSVSILWLLLHARRSELVAILIVSTLYLREVKGFKFTLIFGLISIFVLVVIGEIRSIALLQNAYLLNDLLKEGNEFGVASLPGGASNVYMTFVDTVHFFSKNSLLLGKTFYNYLLQILPSPIYHFLNIKVVPYFSEKVLAPNYQYNGGTYAAAIFYGNFAETGILLYGVFISFYIKLAYKFVGSQLTSLFLAGLFLVGFSLRGFWYEMINIIKPFYVFLIIQFVISIYFKIVRKKNNHIF